MSNDQNTQSKPKSPQTNAEPSKEVIAAEVASKKDISAPAQDIPDEDYDELPF